jgi:hypothetical protein
MCFKMLLLSKVAVSYLIRGSYSKYIVNMKVAAALAFLVGSAAAFAPQPAAQKSSSALSMALPPKNTDNKGLQNVFYQNQAWKAEKLTEDPDFFKKLGSTHKPEFMWIGCADARVPPNVIMGEEAGEFLVMTYLIDMG